MLDGVFAMMLAPFVVLGSIAGVIVALAAVRMILGLAGAAVYGFTHDAPRDSWLDEKEAAPVSTWRAKRGEYIPGSVMHEGPHTYQLERVKVGSLGYVMRRRCIVCGRVEEQ